MSEHVLEECSSLRAAMGSVKDRLKEMDAENLRNREFWKAHDPSRLKESMEEENWSDDLYLVYRLDMDDTFYIFEDEYEIEKWLEGKWDDWCLWEYDDINEFLVEDLVIWKFHRNICIEKWEILYRTSKPFIDGWSRKRVVAEFEAVPSFSVG